MPFDWMKLLGAEDEPPDASSRISWLRSLGDRDALAQVMESNPQNAEGLAAAEALAVMGDVRGLDHLIATLASPMAELRLQATEILVQLNHPRGLRALQERAPVTQNSARAQEREVVHEDLNAATTDELVAIWHENDRKQWSALELDVIREILVERLGKPPRRDAQEAARDEQDVDEGVNPRIRELWLQGDVDGLSDMFDNQQQAEARLETAEALADLGDDRALDFLVESLDDTNEDIRAMAAEILDWLDLPRGNAALEDRGIEFEMDSEESPDNARPREQRPSPEAAPPAAPRDSWAAATPRPSATVVPRAQTSSEYRAQPVWQQAEAGGSGSPAMLLTGAAGGLLGLALFSMGLWLLGSLPPLQGSGGWMRTALLYYLAPSLVAGAAFGVVGSRVAQSLAGRLGWEPSEGDLMPVLGALVEGATAALALDIFLYTLLGP